MAERRFLPITHLAASLVALHHTGLQRGDDTGWPEIDKYLSIAPGQMTIVTGWPGSGKTEWMECLLVHLVRQHGWYTALYSPENWPLPAHASRLLEKWLGAPFNAGPTPRLEADEIEPTLAQMADNIAILNDPHENAPNLWEIINLADDWFEANAGPKRALVIDPWNEVDHARPASQTETDYVSYALGAARRWARAANVHLFIVAHPAKPRRENGNLPVATPDLIAGSAHFWNKADNCVSVWRDPEDNHTLPQIHIQKVKYKHIGHRGIADLQFDRATGRFLSPKRDSSGRAYVTSLHRVPATESP